MTEFATTKDFEELRNKVHEMDKQLVVLESDFKNFNAAFATIIAKLETLPDKVTAQLGKTIQQEILTHSTTCRLDNANKDRVADQGLIQWLIKNQTQILLYVLILVAAYFGVKLP